MCPCFYCNPTNNRALQSQSILCVYKSGLGCRIPSPFQEEAEDQALMEKVRFRGWEPKQWRELGQGKPSMLSLYHTYCWMMLRWNHQYPSVVDLCTHGMAKRQKAFFSSNDLKKLRKHQYNRSPAQGPKTKGTGDSRYIYIIYNIPLYSKGWQFSKLPTQGFRSLWLRKFQRPTSSTPFPPRQMPWASQSAAGSWSLRWHQLSTIRDAQFLAIYYVILIRKIIPKNDKPLGLGVHYVLANSKIDVWQVQFSQVSLVVCSELTS